MIPRAREQVLGPSELRRHGDRTADVVRADRGTMPAVNKRRTKPPVAPSAKGNRLFRSGSRHGPGMDPRVPSGVGCAIVIASRRKRSGPKVCPACGAALHRGIGHRHSEGPGRASRWLGIASGPLGLAAAVGAIWFGRASFGGFGPASAALAGILVWAVMHHIASLLPRTIRFQCKACAWWTEIAV